MKKAMAFAVLLGLLAGCAGYEVRSSLPDTINKLSVPVFRNVTGQPGLEQDLTQKVAQAFIVDGRLVITDPAQADAQLIGVIQSYEKLPLLRDENQVPVQYKMLMAVDLTFNDLKTQKQLWTTHKMIEVDNFAQGSVTATSRAYDSTNVSTLSEYTTYYVLNKMGMPPEDETTARNRLVDQMTRRVVERTLFGF